jgi:hypothetical protein
MFALATAFFGWTSAEPFWLSVGHGVTGTATVSATCSAHRHCATFVSESGSETLGKVTLLGTDAGRAGTTLPARMVSTHSSAAYPGTRNALYLRWVPGLGMVLLCGLGLAWTTGAFRIPGRRARLIGLCLAAPLILTAGIFAASW